MASGILFVKCRKGLARGTKALVHRSKQRDVATRECRLGRVRGAVFPPEIAIGQPRMRDHVALGTVGYGTCRACAAGAGPELGLALRSRLFLLSAATAVQFLQLVGRR